LTPGPRVVHKAGSGAFPGFRLRVVERTPSTQDVVRAAARAGAEAGFCCVALEQSAGRGRQGRAWVAPRGTALLASVLLRVRAGAAGVVPLAAGVAVCDAVGAMGVAEGAVGLKWPNDVLVRDGLGKLCGLLAEVEGAGRGEPVAVVLGIGLNLTVAEFPAGVHGDSLHRLAGREVGWEEALAALLDALGRRTAELVEGGAAATVAAWRRCALGLGAPVEAHTPAGVIRGTAQDVAPDGALLLDTGAGVERLVAGDVHLGPTPPPAPSRRR